MARIKSFSVWNGDMFYILHWSNNFTLIDCCLPIDDDNRKNEIIEEIKRLKDTKSIMRFISTHPDQDHMYWLKELDESINILNFYCVKNEATKDDPTEDFQHYCKLRDDKKTFYIYKWCKRKWMNDDDGEVCKIWKAWIHVLWPITNNEHYIDALEKAKNWESPNNISPIITYTINNGPSIMWMGDIESDFMDKIKDVIDLPKTDIVFAPHHGRTSWKIPTEWLEQLDPSMIIIGEAPSDHLDYYDWYNTITQNSAKDITLEITGKNIDIYVGNENYNVNFLKNNWLDDFGNDHYLWTLEI